jgi:tetratricopeptide (TPR) repeat protein
MFEDLLKTFTNRREAIALFERIRQRDSHQSSWPLLPILTFIAPGGSGKSTLIEYLISRRCSKDGHAVLPFAHIDFTEAVTLRDLLPILIELRDQLQNHDDGQGNHLNFPRFDLGASIAFNAPLESRLPHPDKDAVRRSLKFALPVFLAINKMGNALGNIYPYIPPLLVGVKWAEQLAWKIQPLQELLLQLEHAPGWQWYQTQEIGIGLYTNAGIRDVLLRLHALSVSNRPGKEGRNYLVNYVLPAAFLADLRNALDGSNSPRTWNASTNIVLFLDGFDALLQSARATGIRLLEVLACPEHRKLGETDPLLLVVGSRERLLELTGTEQHFAQNPPFEQQTSVEDDVHEREEAQERYVRWSRQLPREARYLRLSDLYLPYWLHDFGLEDTRHFLAQLDRQELTVVFADEVFVQSIHYATHGHPLYLSLAAAAGLESRAPGQHLTPEHFEHAPVPLLWDLAPGHEDERMGDYLLDLFLRQLSPSERNELIFCATPRLLDAAIVQTVLQLPNNVEARGRWDHYHRLTFVRALDDERIILHPVVRTLLLRRLPSDSRDTSDYHRVHTRLKAYFHDQAHMQIAGQRRTEQQAQVEEAYHGLALGDPEPAIRLGILAQRDHLSTWEPLLEAIEQASTGLISLGSEQRAYEALLLANQHHTISDCVTAIVLYKWHLSAHDEATLEFANIQNNLGLAYTSLPGGDRQANLEKAIDCYQKALQVYTKDATPTSWAKVQRDLGVVYRNLPGSDQQENLKKAINHYNMALQVYSRDAFPLDWAIGLPVSFIQNRPTYQITSGSGAEAIDSRSAALSIITAKKQKNDLLVSQMPPR